jgi:hypothetical protein
MSGGQVRCVRAWHVLLHINPNTDPCFDIVSSSLSVIKLVSYAGNNVTTGIVHGDLG